MGIPAAIGIAASGQPNAGDQANAVLSGTITGVGPTAPFAFRGPMNLAFWASINTALTTTANSLTASVGSATGLAAGDATNSVNVPPGATIGVLSGTTVTLALPPVEYQCSGLSVSSASLQLPAGSNASQLVGSTLSVPSTAEGVTFPASTTVVAVLQADIAPSRYSPGQPALVQLSAAPTAVPNDPQPRAISFTPTKNAIVTTGADNAAVFTGAAVSFSATLQLERSFDGGNTWIVCNIGNVGTLAQWTAGTPVSLTFGEPEKQVIYRFNCTVYTSGTINYRISQTGGAAESLAIGPLTGG